MHGEFEPKKKREIKIVAAVSNCCRTQALRTGAGHGFFLDVPWAASRRLWADRKLQNLHAKGTSTS
jgi:hypothetical protein